MNIREDQPLRDTNQQVIDWLASARSRPDADQLYLHGSREDFLEFRQPNLSFGHLIFFSKLTGENRHPNETLQAEYYGPKLYLAKLATGHRFNPYQDPKAKQILAAALPANSWDREQKQQWGRVDYQDLYQIVPPAVAAGYNRFRVYEVSMRGDSHAVTDPKMVTIIDRFHKSAIAEDVESDVNMHDLATKAAHMVAKHLYDGNKPVDYRFVLNGKEYFALTPQSVGWTQEFGIDDVIILIAQSNPKAIGYSGGVVRFTGDRVKGFGWGIFIDCLPAMRPELVTKMINTVEGIQVLSHEVLHYLDRIRTKGKAIARPAAAPGDKAAYYNDPAEFNAYFHDLANNLLSFVRDVKTHNYDAKEARELAEIFNIDVDFKKMVAQVARSHHGPVATFYKWLSDDRRKTLLRRLYRLHQEVVKLMVPETS